MWTEVGKLSAELEKTKEQLEQSQKEVEEKNRETANLKQQVQHMTEELCELQASSQEQRTEIHRARQVTVNIEPMHEPRHAEL